MEQKPTLIVDVKLSSRLSLTQNKWLLRLHLTILRLELEGHVVDGDEIGLIAAGPDHKVCIVDVGRLLLDCFGLNQFEPFLGSVGNILVKLLGISS